MNMYGNVSSGGVKRITTNPDKVARREAAVQRQEAYDNLSNEEKVSRAGTKQLGKFIKAGGALGALAEAATIS